MELLHVQIDSTEVIHSCHAKVKASDGKTYTIYGEIKNRKVRKEATDASFFNAREFRELPEQEQKEIKDSVNEALSELDIDFV